MTRKHMYIALNALHCGFIIHLMLLLLWPGATQAAISHTTRFDPKTGADFKFADTIEFPAYAWPRTLLDCPVDFTDARITTGELMLIDRQTNRSIPFQLSKTRSTNGYLVGATVHFFSDLPSGDERHFVLQRRDKQGSAISHAEPEITVENKGDLIEVSNGTIRVVLPAKRLPSDDGVIGPIAAISCAGRNLGTSYLRSGDLSVTEAVTKIIATGPLFAEFEVHYQFSNGGRYIARIMAIAGYEYIAFEETIEGLTKADGVFLEMRWNGLDPKYRFAAGYFTEGRGIDDPFVTANVLEDPHWSPAWREEPSREMVMRLLPFQGNHARESTPCVSFWEDARPDGVNLELGLFVLDHQKWQDHEYKTWQHSTKLQVTFRYTDGVLYWMWPLADGSRSTALSVTDPEDGQAQVEQLRDIYAGQGFKVERWPSPRYVQLLHQRYGTLSLNRVKNWVLDYPATALQPQDVFQADMIKNTSTDKYENDLFKSVFVQYPFGINFPPGGFSISHRFVYSQVVPEYTKLVRNFTPQQKKRIDALLLLAGYVTYGEEMHPIRTAVAGCPNMAADGWCVPPQMAFLFPEHPMAREWLDYYERTWDITHRKYTRPDVPACNSVGGRWTESLGTYNWAHLRPTGFSQIAGLLTDGKNRWATPEASLRGRWMVDMLTAPIYNPHPYWRQSFGSRRNEPEPLASYWQPGMPFNPELGFTRQYPAHGAHGSGTAQAIPQIVEYYGHFMHHYDPLLAEHMLWAAHQGNARNNAAFESHTADPWLQNMQARYPENTGTNPHLKSEKYTGHGIVLRAGVDTPEELSIHLDQVDRGPNYRWGVGGENASGSLYFFANGRPYNGHERESSGDRALNDTDGVTTFGVMKNGSYRSIGMNVLEKPLYDLGVAQFAEVTSRNDESAYAWPEYQSRSIMLVGTDYWVLTDHIQSDWRFRGRFTWFTARDLDFPKLVFLNPEGIRQDHWTEIQTPMSKGFHRDFHGVGDFLHTVLVTHKDAVGPSHMTPIDLPYLSTAPIKQYRRGRGFDTPSGAWRIQTERSRDIVFRSLEPVNYANDEGDVFEGSAGVIRHLNDGTVEMAMFHSRMMGVTGLTVEVDSEDIGIGGHIANERAKGVFMAPQAGTMILTAPHMDSKTLYIDSHPVAAVRDGNSMTATLPEGQHTWQLVTGPPRPAQPVIQKTEYLKDGVRLVFNETAGARDYIIELSPDGGASWVPQFSTAETEVTLPGLAPGKVHVRVTARHGEWTSPPAYEWPIYVTGEPPHYPEGLRVEITNQCAVLTWGHVLGTTGYRLYRRVTGTDDYELVYSGPNRRHTDKPPEPLANPYALPGAARNANQVPPTIYEYAVSAVNGYGESDKSQPVSTDPASWLVWKPAGPVGYSRRSAFWEPPYVPPHMVPPDQYPGKVDMD